MTLTAVQHLLAKCLNMQKILRINMIFQPIYVPSLIKQILNGRGRYLGDAPKKVPRSIALQVYTLGEFVSSITDD